MKFNHLVLNVMLPATFVVNLSSGHIAWAADPAKGTPAPKPALATKKAAPRRVDRQRLALLKENLAKTDKSIALTKQKIRTSKDIQFLPELYLSLAELLIDKSRLKYSMKLEQAGDRKTEDLDFTAEKMIKSEAIEALTQIEERYPNYVGLDRVVFAIAHEYREMGENEQALKTFKRLLDKFPSSEFWAEAMYSIGNIYYDKKDYEFALGQYKKILTKPDAKMMSMMAYYKMGQCYLQLDKPLDALQAFEQVFTTKIEIDPEKLPEDFKRKDMREEALVASVKPLSDLPAEDLLKNPKYQYPLEYYTSLAPNRPAFRSLLARLAKRMTLKNRHDEASRAWFALLEVSNDLNQGKEALESFFIEKKKTQKVDYPENSSRLVSQFLFELKQEKPAEIQRFEPVLRDIATSFHKSGLATKRAEDIDRAIEAYKDYLWIYPETKYKNEISLNMAESAFHAGRFVEAGLGYGKMVTLIKDSKKNKEYFFSAFESFNQAFKAHDKLSLLEKTQGQASYALLVDSFYRRDSQNPAMPTILYNLAKSLYDSQDYISASQRFYQLLQRFPNDKNAQAAAVIYLDCFYVRDDLKSLVEKGNALMAFPLQSSVKKEIQSVIQQSQLKRVRSIAGDFATKGYADQFMKFAKEAGKSTLGETALLEAFVSLKASQDIAALKVGEQFVGQYGNSDKAKTVLSNMIQLALAAADFSKAATYLAAFSQKYPNDESSSKFALTAAQFQEALGNLEQAADIYQALGDHGHAGDIFLKNQRWADLQKIAPRIPGLKGLYYLGLAQYRLGQKDSAMRLMERAFNSTASTAQEKQFIAHAGYLMALQSYENYRKVASNGVSNIGDIKLKAAALAETDKVLWKTLETGVGSWVVAGMRMQAVLYEDFAKFLKRGPAPKPLTPAQYQQMTAPQIQNYLKNAGDIFVKCARTAEQSDVFSTFVESCQSRKLGLVDEAASERPVIRSVASVGGSADLRAKLLKDPANTDLLNQLAQTFMKNGDPAQANAVYNRVLEIKPKDPNAMAQIGVVHMFQGSWDEAYAYFGEALKKDSKNVTALWGLVGIYNKFGYKEKLNKALNQARAAGKPSTVVHPLMKL